ncbi:MAG: hypothetical protein JW745_03560 [Sedimentisphaerales bacterium]|nr:hypothetical protein [Sedimentisphaerales bacterium]
MLSYFMKAGKSAGRVVLLAFIFIGVAVELRADITYTFHLDGVETGLRTTIENSVNEAVKIFNKHCSVNKHLRIYYNAGVPTAQASWNGDITFGGSRSTRVAMHEIGHTLGVGQLSAWSVNMVSGIWQGYYANKKGGEFNSPYGLTGSIHGDYVHFWPWGLNYDSEDSFVSRIRATQVMAALQTDMGVLSVVDEPEDAFVAEGGQAVFSLVAPLASSYQWYKTGNATALVNNAKVSGATTSVLKLNRIEPADAGSYYCVLNNGALSCRPARLILAQQVGHWSFDGNVADSVGSNNGVMNGTGSYVSGKVGTALAFNGSNTSVTLPTGVADGEDLTVAAWVYWNGGSSWQRIFDFGTSSEQYLFLTPSNGSLMRLAIKNGDAEQVVNYATKLPTGQWVHLAAVLRGDVATLYVNGKPAANNTSFTIDTRDFDPDRNYIGKSQFSADPLFNGRIDEFRIYNYAISGADIWSLWAGSANAAPELGKSIKLPDATEAVAYNGVSLTDYAVDPDNGTLTYTRVSGPAWLNVSSAGILSGAPDNSDKGENIFTFRVTDQYGASDESMVRVFVKARAGHWSFDGDLTDSAGGNTAVLSGAGSYVAGKSGNALSFNGSDTYLSLPANVNASEDITIAAWVYWNGGGAWQRVFDFGTGTNQYFFLTPSTGSVMRLAIKNGNAEQAVSYATTMPTGQWLHIAGVLRGDVATLYLNGKPVSTNSSVTINPTDLNSVRNYIGKSQFSDPLFNGRIDEFRVYNYAVSGASVWGLWGGSANSAPEFNADISLPAARENAAYPALGLAGYVTDADNDVLTFTRLSGPAWLKVSAAGVISGTPTSSDKGVNTFIVRVSDQDGASDDISLDIVVRQADEVIFMDGLIDNVEAVEARTYSGNSLTDYVNTSDCVFSKVSGPAWLAVNLDGSLCGRPADKNIGLNSFVVKAVAADGGTDTVQMNVNVYDSYSGLSGLSDLQVMAENWLNDQGGCVSFPATDLDNNSVIDLADFALMGGNWLKDEACQLYMAFSESYGISTRDDSYYLRSGTLVNGPAWTAGISGNALSFDGIDDYVQVNCFAGIGQALPRTITAYIKPVEDINNSSKKLHCIVSWGLSASNGFAKWFISLDDTTGQLALGIYGARIKGGPSLEDGLWHHIAVVLPEGATNINQIKLFVDGLQVTTNAIDLNATINTSPTEVLIGAVNKALRSGEYDLDQFFAGSIDELYIYDRELTIQEISQQLR